MVGMASRSKRRKPAWRETETPPVPNLGAHWRSDGAAKTAYRSQQDALAAADERRLETGSDLNVYQCSFCHAWHMGKRGGRGG
jgi:hypothetical protein